MKKAIIITGGEITDYSCYKDYLKDTDFVICADGGSRHLNKLCIYADYFLGDFDSCDFDDTIKSEFLKNAEVIKYKVEKDATDTEIALDLAIELKCDKVIIIGALGSRFDHTLSNVFLLKKALKANVDAIIINEKNEIKLTDKSVCVNPVNNSYISLIALEEVKNLTLKNLKYPLENFTLSQGTSIGISNEFTEKKAEIIFESGLLLVMVTKD